MSISLEVLAHPYILFAARAIVALLLMLGGLGKLMNLKEFKGILFGYKILPKRVVPLFSYSLPVVELVTGIALLLKLFTPVIEYIAAGLFLVFVVAIATNLLRGQREIPCGCFSGWSDKISWRLVIRNMTLACMAFLSMGRLIYLSLILLMVYGVTVALHFANRTEPKPAKNTT